MPDDRRFPVLYGYDWRLVGPKRTSIPWGMIAPHEAQAQRNHGQSLETLCARGGLSPTEMVAVLEDRKWPGEVDHKAATRLETLVLAWESK